MTPQPRRVPCPQCPTMLSMADRRCPSCGSTATPGAQRAVAERRAVKVASAAAFLAGTALLALHLL